VSLLIEEGHLFSQNVDLTSSKFHTGIFSKKHMIEIYNIHEGNSQIPFYDKTLKWVLTANSTVLIFSIRCEFSSVNVKHHNFNSRKPL